MSHQSELPNAINTDGLQQLKELKKQITQIQVQMTKMETQYENFIKTQQLKIDRLASAIERCEKMNVQLAEDTTMKIAQIATRITGKRAIQEQVQEMLDKQSATVKNFETKLHKLRQLLSEKESQIVCASEALANAHREIERLRGH